MFCAFCFVAGAVTPPLAYVMYIGAGELRDLWRNLDFYADEDNITMLSWPGRVAFWLMCRIKTPKPRCPDCEEYGSRCTCVRDRQAH